MIFVVGNARSGTNWLGRILQSHPQIRCTVEEEPMFGWSAAMAFDHTLVSALFPKLCDAYVRRRAQYYPWLYADKSHTNLWLSEALAKTFPDALFIGIKREPFSCVASMIRHGGVMDWCLRWKDAPVPNQFLGIGTEIAKEYDGFPDARRAALRWLAHAIQMEALKRFFRDRIMVIDYTELCEGPLRILSRLQDFLGLRCPFPIPQVERRANYVLTRQEYAEVASVVGEP